jgi:hypothetical protein
MAGGGLKRRDITEIEKMNEKHFDVEMEMTCWTRFLL